MLATQCLRNLGTCAPLSLPQGLFRSAARLSNSRSLHATEQLSSTINICISSRRMAASRPASCSRMGLVGRRHLAEHVAKKTRCSLALLRCSGTSSPSWCSHRHQKSSTRAFSSGPKSDSGSAQQKQKNNRTHYDVLNITPPSNQSEIKKAYLRGAKDCHPDRHGDSRTQQFQRLTAAYTVLSDENKKADYDANGYQDYEDLNDKDKVKSAFRQKMKEMFGNKTRAQIARALVVMYVKVYLLLYVALFVMSLPLYLAGWALQLVLLPFRLMFGI